MGKGGDPVLGCYSLVAQEKKMNLQQMRWAFSKMAETDTLETVLSVFTKPSVDSQRVISSLYYTPDLKFTSFTVELYLKSSQLLLINLFDW